MTDFEQRILQIINRSPGIKAKEIAREIGCTRKDVNSVLYTSLQNNCWIDHEYKWHPKDKLPDSGGKNMDCKFLAQLSKLRKLSMESVENTASFDEFKKYLHVLRPVEEELRSLLLKVNATNKKTLILLCGSAGDGKSHLISYLKHADVEHLLDGYELYNDATESSAPQLTNSFRELNLVQPLSAMNIYFFVECYQKEVLDILSNNACFSLRYHRKNSDLFYRRKSKKIVDYFEKTSEKIDRGILQQTGAYFKIHKFNSVSSFTNSRLWQQCNFKYRNFAKIDYKSCFDSIYTHVYKWCIEKDTVDSKDASNSNLHIVIDRVLQNINGRSSNGLIVGPEFSRMIAEILLQEIDVEAKRSLEAQGLHTGADYRVFRYVDDIYIFSHTQAHTDLIIRTIETTAQKYLLRFNEFKYLKADTPVVLSSWLGKARALSDRISGLFYRKQELHDMEEKKPLLKSGYISIDRIKDDFIYLVNEFPNEQRYIVSFMLSTLLNNISNKKDGYTLFEPEKCARAFVLLDLAMYIYL